MPELPERIRAFIAIHVSPEVQRAIEDLIARLRSRDDGIKWVASMNLHLTLKFLGSTVPIEKIRRIQPKLEDIAAGTVPFELEATGVGGFPSLTRPNVLWVGLRSDRLTELAARVDDAASICGFERERRAFNGHLTIARLGRPQISSETQLRLAGAMQGAFDASTIREMTLYRSITAPAGPIYEALANFQFKSPI